MQKERIRNTRRHPLHDLIVAAIEEGGTNVGIGAALGCNKRTVARVREIIGHPPNSRTTTPAQKMAARAVPDGEHVAWTGRRGPTGIPSIRVHNTTMSASHVAFEQRTGRKPVGIVKTECGYTHCLNGAHLSDEIERRAVRLQERALYGMDAPWSICGAGLHDWDTWGRIEPKTLSLYCAACNTERARRIRQARQEELPAHPNCQRWPHMPPHCGCPA
jgi:hypothetical protein